MVEDHLLILLESAARQDDPLARAERDRLVARIAEHADNTAVFLDQALGTMREKGTNIRFGIDRFDQLVVQRLAVAEGYRPLERQFAGRRPRKIGSASCREGGWQYV